MPAGCPNIFSNSTTKMVLFVAIGSALPYWLLNILNVTWLLTIALRHVFISFGRLKSPLDLSLGYIYVYSLPVAGM